MSLLQQGAELCILDLQHIQFCFSDLKTSTAEQLWLQACQHQKVGGW